MKTIILNINILATTCHRDPRYIYWSDIDFDNKTLLKKIIILSEKLYNNGMITFYGTVNAPYEIPLNNEISLKFLAPDHKEVEEYARIVDIKKNYNVNECSKAANILSTIIQIYSNAWCILLTSDATKTSLERIYSRNIIDSLNSKLLLVQVPHHGSISNHFNLLWDLYQNQNIDAVISCGLNEKYKLPSYPVIKYFFNSGYNIKATNIVYGMVQF